MQALNHCVRSLGSLLGRRLGSTYQWLGFGAAFKHVLDKDIRNLQTLQEMYNQWPFFRVTIDLVEMVFAKGDPGIAALYDKLLVSEDLWSFGKRLRANYEETKQLLLQVIV